MSSKYNIDLSGKKFGKLTVIKWTGEYTTNNGCIGYQKWLCLCDCGKNTITSSYSLLKGLSKSCGILGCGASYIKNPDLTGKKFGKLKVINMVTKRKYRQIAWRCRCECGNIIEVITTKLKKGKTTHCGCSLIKYEDRTIPAKKELYINYKIRANKKNLEFNLSFEFFCDLISKNCFYCQSPPINIRRCNTKYNNISQVTYNGIDRINNLEGYTEDNCVTCCFICNSAKRTKTFTEFVGYIQDLRNNYEKICG